MTKNKNGTVINIILDKLDNISKKQTIDGERLATIEQHLSDINGSFKKHVENYQTTKKNMYKRISGNEKKIWMASGGLTAIIVILQLLSLTGLL